MAGRRIHPFLRRRFSECNGCSQGDCEQQTIKLHLSSPAVGAVCDRPGAHRAPLRFAYCASIAAYRCAASSHESDEQGTNFFNWMLVATFWSRGSLWVGVNIGRVLPGYKQKNGHEGYSGMRNNVRKHFEVNASIGPISTLSPIPLCGTKTRSCISGLRGSGG